MNVQLVYEWYLQDRAPTSVHKQVSSSRDIFQARLDSMHSNLRKQFRDSNSIALLVAVAGEIGNNCFDHNLGQWGDVAGCWFESDIERNKISIVIADRGQGVLSSLKKVMATLKNDQMALEIAFEKRISGRSPEKRGNGLKFVRDIINGYPSRGLLFFSGQGKITLGGFSAWFQEQENKLQIPKSHSGTFALMGWEIQDES